MVGNPVPLVFVVQRWYAMVATIIVENIDDKMLSGPRGNVSRSLLRLGGSVKIAPRVRDSRKSSNIPVFEIYTCGNKIVLWFWCQRFSVSNAARATPLPSDRNICVCKIFWDVTLWMHKQSWDGVESGWNTHSLCTLSTWSSLEYSVKWIQYKGAAL